MATDEHIFTFADIVVSDDPKDGTLEVLTDALLENGLLAPADGAALAKQTRRWAFKNKFERELQQYLQQQTGRLNDEVTRKKIEFQVNQLLQTWKQHDSGAPSIRLIAVVDPDDPNRLTIEARPHA